jgi:hypothetical protein
MNIEPEHLREVLHTATNENEGHIAAGGVSDIKKHIISPRVVWEDVKYRAHDRSYGRITRRGSRSQRSDSISSI